MTSAGSVSENELSDLEIDPIQWDVIEDDGVFAWNAPDGAPLVHFDVEDGESAEEPQELVMPPERVRFTTLVNLKEVGAKVYFEGVIVNISTEGVACMSPHQLKVGARVWITFRLGLLETPMSLLCEVAWERVPEVGDPNYGFKFIEIMPNEVSRIEELVRERSEGRAGEWPMPMLPSGGESTPEGVSPWVSGLIGLLLGAGLTLLLSFQPVSTLMESFGSAQREVKSTPPAQAVAGDSLLAQLEETAKEQPRAELNKDDVVPATEGKVPASEPIQPSKAAGPELAPELVPELVPEPVVEDTTSIMEVREDRLVPVVVSDELTLELRTGDVVSKYKSFWLSKPRRLVVDVLGNVSGFERLLYTVEHPLVERLRIGPYEDKVRFVIELSESATGKLRVNEGRLLAEVVPR